MDKLFIEKIYQLGFEKGLDNLYYFINEESLFSTKTPWFTFVFLEDNKYFLSDSGELIETFDAPDIDLDSELEYIKNEISNFGCRLDVSKITKEIDINNFESELENFTKAVLAVDNHYKEIKNG